MHLLSVAETAKQWGISQRSVRNYCAQGRVDGAVLQGKTWYIPTERQKPSRINGHAPVLETLLDILKRECKANEKGGIYHKIQVDFTYHSNHLEGNPLTHEQTRYIFESNTIGGDNQIFHVDDILETANHFQCIDLMIQQAGKPLTEKFIKELHFTLKHGTSDSRKDWFSTGDYKKLPNEIGGQMTTAPEKVQPAMRDLLTQYNGTKAKTLDEILAFHVAFETIHPFQDGNGRVGRLILFQECLRNHITPFVIGEQNQTLYYQGIQQWNHDKGYLLDTCLASQEQFKQSLEYFRITYAD